MPDSQAPALHDSALADVAPAATPLSPHRVEPTLADVAPLAQQRPALADRVARRRPASLRSLALAAVAMRGCSPDAPADEPAEMRFLREYLELTVGRGG